MLGVRTWLFRTETLTNRSLCYVHYVYFHHSVRVYCTVLRDACVWPRYNVGLQRGLPPETPDPGNHRTHRKGFYVCKSSDPVILRRLQIYKTEHLIITIKHT